MSKIKLDSNIYDLTQNTQGMLFQALRKAQPDVDRSLDPLPLLFQIRSGYAESPAWFMIQASEFDPEPLTVENLRVRDIYASERIVQAVLELLAGERWLARDGKSYHLTNEGRQIVSLMRSRSSAYLNAPALDWPMQSLALLTERVGHIINQSLKPNGGVPPWSLVHSRNRAPADSAPTMQRLSQYFSDFNAFRDDAHMAAWFHLDLQGYEWESFALVAAGQAADAASLFNRLFFRGYSQPEYHQALNLLVDREWLSISENKFMLTSKGKAIFNEVEVQTDQYFYDPWLSRLSVGEINETVDLLQEFYTCLKHNL